MRAIFYQSDLNSPVSLNIEPVAIQPVSGSPVIPDAAPLQDVDVYTRPFANQQLNSRLIFELPDGIWEIRWQADIPENYPPEFVLIAPGRILLQQQEGSWQLFDRSGEAISQGGRGEGDITIDAANGLFYHCHHLGFVSVRDLATGEERFLLSSYLGEGFRRSLISRDDQRLTILSTQLPAVTEGILQKPEYAVIEIQELGTPLRTDEDNVLLSATTLLDLIAYSMPFHIALHDRTLVIAVPDHIFLADENANITGDLQGRFTPLSMSLDEGGRIYMIVRTENERYALWVVTQEGNQLVDVEIPASPDHTFTPPVIGYDHRIYVTIENRILAISPESALLWERYVAAPIAGATVTADNQLLVSSGNSVTAFDAMGDSNFLYFFEDEYVSTPPILTQRGRIIVATQRKLYYLALRQ